MADRRAALARDCPRPRRREPGRRARRGARRAVADRGLLRVEVAVVFRSALRRGQGPGRRVQRQGHDVRGSAIRHGRVHQQQDRRDQEPDGLHGRLPDDDRQGHLHHQRHRACRGVPAGPLAGCLLRRDHRQVDGEDAAQRQGHPRPRRVAGVRHRQARHRRCAHRPQAPPAGHRAAQGAGLDQRADRRALRLLRDHDGDAGEGQHRRHRRGAAGHLPQAAPRRSADQGVRADPAGEPVLQGEALRPGPGGSLQGQQEARAEHRQADHRLHADQRGRRRHHRVPGAPARGPDHDDGARRRRGAGGDRRHRPLRQPAAAHRRRADPEPDPGRPVADGARRARADDDSGRRGDHAADPDQHPPGRGGDQRVLRHQPAVAVHGPEQPAVGSDP